MKRTYLFAAGLMMALGVVSTLAFTLNSATGVVPNPVLIESEADNDITRIIVLPGDEDEDDVRDANAIRLLIKTAESRDNSNDELDCTFIFMDSSYDPIDITGMTAFYKATGGSWTSIASPTITADLGEISFTIVPTSGEVDMIWIELELTSIYTNTQKLQASVDVVTVS